MFYDVSVPKAPGTVLLAFCLSSLSFAAVGILLGAIIPTTRAAQGIGVILFFIMLVLAGAGPPRPSPPADALPRRRPDVSPHSSQASCCGRGSACICGSYSLRAPQHVAQTCPRHPPVRATHSYRHLHDLAKEAGEKRGLVAQIFRPSSLRPTTLAMPQVPIRSWNIFL